MYSDSLTILDGLKISAFSILTVFIVLLIISCMIDFFAVVLGLSSGKFRKSGEKTERTEKVFPTGNTSLNESSKDMMLIMAAIAAYMGTRTDNLQVKSLKRIQNSSSIWQNAAKIENMRK